MSIAIRRLLFHPTMLILFTFCQLPAQERFEFFRWLQKPEVATSRSYWSLSIGPFFPTADLPGGKETGFSLALHRFFPVDEQTELVAECRFNRYRYGPSIIRTDLFSLSVSYRAYRDLLGGERNLYFGSGIGVVFSRLRGRG